MHALKKAEDTTVHHHSLDEDLDRLLQAGLADFAAGLSERAFMVAARHLSIIREAPHVVTSSTEQGAR